MNIKPTTSPQKVFYEDINIIRLMLIVLLVIYHSFCPYAYFWPFPESIAPNMIYEIISKISYSFMLPMFVFISGFLFEKSWYKYQDREGLFLLIKNKFKRLIVPSCIFSLIYCYLFNPLPHHLYELPYLILNGVGHLWFLPMLFWCFIIAWFFKKIKYFTPQIVIAFLLSIFSLGILPLQIGNSCYYFLYFFLGIIGYKYQLKIKSYFKFKYLFLSLVLYVIVMFLHLKYSDSIVLPNDTNLQKYFLSIVLHLCAILLAIPGILFSYLSINVLIKRGVLYSTPNVFKLGNYCMGVYIIQQFILKGLYYHTSFPQWVGSLALPWLGFLITLIGSLSIVHLMLKSKIGRFLIG